MPTGAWLGQASTKLSPERDSSNSEMGNGQGRGVGQRWEARAVAGAESMEWQGPGGATARLTQRG
eukprot:2007240-Alexandrium_andersonii.AAC.1